MDGGGCDFWKWQEDYEQWLVDNKHVPPSYQPVFHSTKMPQLEEHTKGDGGQLEQLKYLIGIAREIVSKEHNHCPEKSIIKNQKIGKRY